MRPALPHVEEGHGDFVGGIGGHGDGGDFPHVDRLFHPHHEGDGQEQRKVQREQERRGRQKDLLPQKLFFRFRLGADPVFRQQDGAPEDDQQKIEYADAPVPDRRKKEAQKPMVQGEQGRDAKGEYGTGERLEAVTLTPSFPKAADLPGLQRVHGVSFPAHCGTSAHIFRSRRRSSPPGRGSLFQAIP